MVYNIFVDPVRHFMHKVFLVENGTRKGRFASRLPILVIADTGSTRASLSGFLYEK